MINRLVINNFRCLREVCVDLKPLTVLIGANNSGKSTFLAAIALLAKGGESFGESDAYRMDNQIPVDLQAETNGAQWLLHWDPLDGQQNRKATLDPAGREKWLRPNGFGRVLQVVLNPATGVPIESKGVPDGEKPPSFGSDGSNVPSLADYLLRTARKTKFEAFEQELQALIPGMEGLDIRTPNPADRRIDLISDNGLRIPGNLLSVGLRMILFYVSLGYHPVEPAIITIEEPENGLHPKRLGEVMKLLRQLTRPSEGRKGSQVILTTHSPYLLDHVDLDTDAVLVCQRQENGERTIEPADRERLDKFLPEFMLGEIWFNEGEDGLLARSSS